MTVDFDAHAMPPIGFGRKNCRALGECAGERKAMRLPAEARAIGFRGLG
jgi:hypothetical protein